MTYLDCVSRFIQVLHDTPSIIKEIDIIDSYLLNTCRSYTQDEFFQKIASDTMCYIEYIYNTYNINGRYYISFSDELNDYGIEDNVYTAVMNVNTGKIDRVWNISFQCPKTMIKQIVTPAGLHFTRYFPVIGCDGKPLMETVTKPRVLFWDELAKEIEELNENQVIIQIDSGYIFFPII